jgi:hypothetical protein
MKRIVLTISLIFILNAVFSQDSTNNIYSGGMLILQPGYLMTQNVHRDIQGLNFGLGGMLRFYFLDFLTAGIYGGTQKTKYKTTASDNSYLSIGYGGVMFGLTKKVNRFRCTLTAFAGRGSITNLHIESQNNHMLSGAYLYKESAFIVSPLLSLDYALSKRLLLTMTTNYLTAKREDNTYLYNPTVQFGLLFNR